MGECSYLRKIYSVPAQRVHALDRATERASERATFSGMQRKEKERDAGFLKSTGVCNICERKEFGCLGFPATAHSELVTGVDLREMLDDFRDDLLSHAYFVIYFFIASVCLILLLVCTFLTGNRFCNNFHS